MSKPESFDVDITAPWIAAPRFEVRWYQRLSFKLALLLFVALPGLALIFSMAWQGLTPDFDHGDPAYASESAARITGDLSRVTQEAEALARTLATLVQQSRGDEANALFAVLRRSVPASVTAIGVWPESFSNDAQHPRASNYWIRRTDGTFESRTGYNDPRAAPYSREPWFTPARLMTDERCYWTPPYTEAVAQRELLTCTYAVRRQGTFVAAVTVSLATSAFEAPLRKALDGSPGYAVLVDRGGRILAASQALTSAEMKPHNLAEWARLSPQWSPIAVDWHGKNEAGQATDTASVTTLQQSTRNLSVAEALEALAAVRRNEPQPAFDLLMAEEPLLNTSARVRVHPMAGTGWSLLRVLPADVMHAAGGAGVGRSAVYATVLIAAFLLLSFSVLNRTLLRGITRLQRGAEGGELPEMSGRDESAALTGVLRQQQRQVRLAEQMANDAAEKFKRESQEAQQAHDRLALAQQCTLALMKHSQDAVILTDALGRIELMNPAAVQMTGRTLDYSKGRELGEIAPLRRRDDGRLLTNLAQSVMDRGKPMEDMLDLELVRANGLGRQVMVTLTPQRTPKQPRAGALLQLRAANEPARFLVAQPLERARHAGTRTTSSVTSTERWAARINDGLKHNRFHLTTQWLQPSTALASEGLCFEVLLTLEDEEGFWAEPAQFMPQAEQLGLAGDIDRWVLRSTFEALEQNPQFSERIAILGVNLSTQTLQEPATLDLLIAQFERHAGFCSKLCLELSEDAWLEQSKAAANFCHTVHRLGARLAADRFGTRRASDLSALARLPLDLVKFDARQLPNFVNNPVERELAESALRVARMHRRRVAVSYVEDPEAMPVWRSLGVDYIQGYALAKPSPVMFSAPMESRLAASG